MSRLSFIFAGALALMVSCTGPAPSDLRAEHQDGPVVIDPGAAPRLSWKNESEQRARRIVVRDGKGTVVWDSGKVLSGDSHLVPYEGAALEPMTDYFWKVRIWDEKGRASSWSAPALITTGPRDWEAQWIGAPWQADERGAWYTRYPMWERAWKAQSFS